MQCKRLIASHAFLFELNVEMRAAVQLRNWIRHAMLNRERLQKQNIAASKIQAAIRGFLVRKRLPQLKYELRMYKQVRAAILIQVSFQFKFRIQNISYICVYLILINFLLCILVCMERLLCTKEVSMQTSNYSSAYKRCSYIGPKTQ